MLFVGGLCTHVTVVDDVKSYRAACNQVVECLNIAWRVVLSVVKVNVKSSADG